MSNSKGSVWFRRLASFASVAYCFLVCRLAYFTFFYDITITNRLVTCFAVSGISFVALMLMLVSRKQIFTKISTIIMIPVLLPVVLIYYGNWEIIVPIVITVLAAFFMSGLSETSKSIIGTIYLLLFVVGALAYFIATTLFSTSVQTSVVSTVASGTGKYRYEVINTKDSSHGSTSVIVMPNDMDVDLDLVKFSIKGFDRTVFLERPITKKIKVKWKTESREQVTKELLDISGEITINLDAEQKATIGVPESEDVKLSDLTNDDFDKLGIAENGDVLMVDGKPVFRYYIAELERYYDDSNREFSLTD